MATPRLSAASSTGVLWFQLSSPLQASITVRGMDGPALFRGLFDGTAAEAREVAQEFGGQASDEGVLVALWKAAESPGRRSVSALASVPTVLASARGAIESRKRGASIPNWAGLPQPGGPQTSPLLALVPPQISAVPFACQAPLMAQATHGSQSACQ